MDIAGTSLDPLLFWHSDVPLERSTDVATSILASMLRGRAGRAVGALGARPERRLILYQMEPCPFSRLVREAASMLDLDVDMISCPDGASGPRGELRSIGGEDKIPFLIDPNTGARLYESPKIVGYLFAMYGDGSVPKILRGPIALRSSKLASAVRRYAGGEKLPARRAEHPLELFGYEGSPYTRLVRERLSAYGLPWICRNLARGSTRRSELMARTGRMQFPYLVDPNTERSLFESDIICEHLDAVYGV